MNSEPKIEKVVAGISLVHFFLMFAYKLFSLYFPLFLAERNFSLLQIGYSTFLIYVPLAIAAPLVGYLNHKINSVFLAACGVLGYALYSVGMIIFPTMWVFYGLQIILGLSAALFFVSCRTVLMKAQIANPNRAFAWFYMAPSYAEAIAPAVGAFLIWKFNFWGAFSASFALEIIIAAVAFYTMRWWRAPKAQSRAVDSVRNYGTVLGNIKARHISPFIFISFCILLVNGFSSTFFVLFLKNLGWTRTEILVFNSLLSLVFLPLSFLIVRFIAKLSSKQNILAGGIISAIFYIILGSLAGLMNFYTIFLMMMGNDVGGLMAGSGRSGLMTTRLKEYPEESAAIDTIFSPLAIGVSGLVGGVLLSFFGYPFIFIAGGALILLFSTWQYFHKT